MPLQLSGKRSASKPNSRKPAASVASNVVSGISGGCVGSQVTSKMPSTLALMPRRTTTRPSASMRRPHFDPSGLPGKSASVQGGT